MRTIRRGTIGRWALVAVIAAVLASIPSIVASLPISTAEPGASVLRQRIVDSADQPYTGYARSQSELGLPRLPDLSDVTSLLSGLTDMRVWYRSPSSNRVDVLTGIGERDVYQTRDGLYTWDYASNLLTEVVGTELIRLPRAGDLLPPDLARRILSMDTVDAVVSIPPRKVAGIATAGIRLRPAATTTVGQVDIWADPASGIPLRVEVTPRGASKPIIISQFFDFDRSTPSDDTLSPPVAAAGGVSVAPSPDILRARDQVPTFFTLPSVLDGYVRQAQLPGLPSVGRYGVGLASFVVLPLPRNVGLSAIDTMTKAGGVTVPVTRGRAVLIQIPLLTVMVEQVGYRRMYLVAGFVDHTVLAQAASELSTYRRFFR